MSIIAAAHKTITDLNTGEQIPDRVAQQMIMKCINKINVLHESSSPEVAQYLLGHPDHYTASTFSPIFVGSFLHEMNKLLDPENQELQNEQDDLNVVVVEKRLNAVNQCDNYKKRSSEMENVCLYEFTSHFAKRKITKNPCGRAFPFQDDHPQCKAFQLVVISEPVVPSLLKIPPRQSDDSSTYEEMILLLFVPFRKTRDLLFQKETWKEAYDYVVNSDQKIISEDMFVILNNLWDIHGSYEQREVDKAK
jgi:hypothetical protein